MINVTKTFLPPVEEYIEKLAPVWKTGWVTNQGPLAAELEKKLDHYLGVNELLLVSNGTIALQLAIKALSLKGEIITTPYSYVATTTAILWENCEPVFCDVEDETFCIDASKIESLITDKTSAILATHVYGFPCNVEKIKEIANKHSLKVIYDGAHAFGVKINGRSVLSYGDISTISFHATKLFHTIEGGAVITNDKDLHDLLFQYRMFGHLDEEYISMGINARTSEFNAAMGLCILPRVDSFIEKREMINELYREYLKDTDLKIPVIPDNIQYNYSYFPVFFKNEKAVLDAMKKLAENDIHPRRYFYPSLNKLPYIQNNTGCSISEDLASRVLCLPVYHDLDDADIKKISVLIKPFAS